MLAATQREQESMQWLVAERQASGGLPEESDSLQTCNLACCDGGLFLLFIEIGRHLHHCMCLSGLSVISFSNPELLFVAAFSLQHSRYVHRCCNNECCTIVGAATRLLKMIDFV